MAVDVSKLNRRYEQLRTDRAGWDSAWRDLSELFLPCRWRSDSDNTAHLSPKIATRLVNSAGVLAMRTLAAGMQGGMTSPVRPWFRLVLKGEQDGRGESGVNAWLDEVTQTMQVLFHQSNFYTAVHGLYADLGTFGTGLLIETADADGIHFHLVRAGEYVLDINGRGEVDTFFRHISMTARQIVDLWGRGENVPQYILSAADAMAGSTARFDVVHAVYPRKDMKAGQVMGPESKPFASVYFLPGGSGASSVGSRPSVLDEGGFDMFPAFAPRWDINGSDVYGRSPAMDVTPDCRMLQAMTRTLREMQHKIADPPLVADSALKSFGVRLAPSALNYVDTTRTGMTPVTPIHQPEPAALNFTMQGIKDVERIIYDGLYTDLFRMLIDDDRRQITATEIQAKQQEKMMLIGPVVERLHKELLEPLIQRTFALMRDWGALPEAPEGMDGTALDVTFESVLAQAQRMTATSAIDQGLAFVVQAAQADPSVMDTLDMDAMSKAYLDRIGMPGSCLRDEDDIAALRQQRAEAQAQQEAQQQAAAATQQVSDVAAAAKNLGQAPTGADGQTLLGTILGGLGGM
ncbi:portal protein [uncultured Mailhella sp.]|uniref:portal protein n=1 Tax=uncultured Mailhella sp. TaxID=1981031 RepID=UPI00262373FC|nr:portal protein [uncultured Mailhella sp.]